MSPPADDRISPPSRGDARLPEPDATEDDLESAPDETEIRSLLEDMEALIEDGRTYLEAEVAFQKARAAFIVDSAKAAAVFGAVAAAFGFVALIGLTVGLIFALTPWLTAWGASALVVLLLGLAALLCARAASSRWAALVAAINGETGERP